MDIEAKKRTVSPARNEWVRVDTRPVSQGNKAAPSPPSTKTMLPASPKFKKSEMRSGYRGPIAAPSVNAPISIPKLL
jgi:hypothetical protein